MTPYFRHVWAAVGLWILAQAAGGQEVTADQYPSLPGVKALAVSSDNDSIIGIAYEQSNDIAAATVALQRCDAQRTVDAGECEIHRLNSETITRGRDILAQVPDSPHPLYLWKYQGPRSTVFLAGSIHLLKPSLYPLPIQYEQAYANTDYLVLEVNTEGNSPQEIAQQTLQGARLPAGQSLTNILPESMYQQVRSHLDRYGLGGAAIDGIKPSLLMNQIVVARLLALGYLPEHGVEEHYLLKAGSREIQQLETLESQLKLLFEQPMPVQIQLLADTLELEMAIEPILTGLLVAWLSGDDAALEQLFEAQSGDSELVRQFNEELLDHRNVQMVDRIREIIANGEGSYFVLVGAAHYLGEQGIPALLASQGIQGRRITSDTPLSTINSD
jgi:uncharacterized protein YbaP (TraB family)